MSFFEKILFSVNFGVILRKRLIIEEIIVKISDSLIFYKHGIFLFFFLIALIKIISIEYREFFIKCDFRNVKIKKNGKLFF